MALAEDVNLDDRGRQDDHKLECGGRDPSITHNEVGGTISTEEAILEKMAKVHRIVIVHACAGMRKFESAWEAALFLLLAEQVPIGEFVRRVDSEKLNLLTSPKNFGEGDLWKYHLLKDNTVESVSLERLKAAEDWDVKKTPRRMVRCKKLPEGQEESLAQSMNICLDARGELIKFSDVKQWKNPTALEMACVRRRVLMEWMGPLQLRQQDIVRASGVGASYICYLLKDPDNSNMTQRRRIEVYSVLTELFQKYDSGEVTDQDFLRLKRDRIQSRYGKRVAGSSAQQQPLTSVKRAKQETTNI